MKSLKTNRRTKRTGAAAVEFAIIAPVMFLFTLGLIDIGRMVMVKQILLNASREGARRASLIDASSLGISSDITASLQNSGITATVTTTPEDISTAPQGSQVTVTVTAFADSVSWTGRSIFMSGKNITASTTMRRESM